MKAKLKKNPPTAAELEHKAREYQRMFADATDLGARYLLAVQVTDLYAQATKLRRGAL